jgi:hypothetical protein
VGAAGSAAPYTKRASSRGGLPQVGANLSRRAAWPMRMCQCLQVQELTGRPPRARHPVAAQRSQSRALAALPSFGWRCAPLLSVILSGKVIGA